MSERSPNIEQAFKDVLREKVGTLIETDYPDIKEFAEANKRLTEISFEFDEIHPALQELKAARRASWRNVERIRIKYPGPTYTEEEMHLINEAYEAHTEAELACQNLEDKEDELWNEEYILRELLSTMLETEEERYHQFVEDKQRLEYSWKTPQTNDQN
ncbi:MAG: hypothetical protein RL094_279 [Candidatus Parcubacteria bacterium]|jgi:hypothetical protein